VKKDKREQQGKKNAINSYQRKVIAFCTQS